MPMLVDDGALWHYLFYLFIFFMQNHAVKAVEVWRTFYRATLGAGFYHSDNVASSSVDQSSCTLQWRSAPFLKAEHASDGMD